MLLYRVINSAEDYTILQKDVDTLSSWVHKNNLTLNVLKCKFMVMSRLRTNSVPVSSLTLNEQPLERVSSYKYLGVNITENLMWSAHVEEISSKARQIVRPSVLHLVISTSLATTLYVSCKASPWICVPSLESPSDQGHQPSWVGTKICPQIML